MKMQNLVPWQDVSANISDPSDSISTAGSLFQTAMGEFNNMIDRKKTSETDKINNDIMAAEDPDKIREMLQGAKENNWADLNSINQTGVGRLDTLFSQNMETDKFDFTKDSEFWNRGFKEKELGQKMAIARMQEEAANARAMYKADQSIKAAMAKSKGDTKAFPFDAGENLSENFHKFLGPGESEVLKGDLRNAVSNVKYNRELYDITSNIHEDPLTGQIRVDPNSIQQGLATTSAAIITNMVQNNPESNFAQYIKLDKKGNFAGFVDVKDPVEKQVLAGYLHEVKQQASSIVDMHSKQAVETATTLRHFPKEIAKQMGDENNHAFNQFAAQLPDLANLVRDEKNPINNTDKVKFLNSVQERYASSGDIAASISAAIMELSDIPVEDFPKTFAAASTAVAEQVNIVMENKDKPNDYMSKKKTNYENNEVKVKSARESEEKFLMLSDAANAGETLYTGTWAPNSTQRNRARTLSNANKEGKKAYDKSQADIQRWRKSPYGATY